MQITDNIHLVGSGALGISHYKDCHIYLLQSNEECVLIDAGVGINSELIIDEIRKKNIAQKQIKYICLTHIHADHAGGAAKIKNWANCPIAAPKSEAYLLFSGNEELLGLKAAKKAGRYSADYQFHSCQADIVISENWETNVGEIKLIAIETPGHSLGSVSYLASLPNGMKHLFSGDTFFSGGHISLQNIPGSNLESYKTSAEKIVTFKIDGLFPGHGLWDICRGQNHLKEIFNKFQKSDLPSNVQL